jgi:hypothetical protein
MRHADHTWPLNTAGRFSDDAYFFVGLSTPQAELGTNMM